MFSKDGRWKLTPRLHSVKFVFDTPTPADVETPEEVVFESPFPTDVPGVPKRFVFRSPTTKGAKPEDIVPRVPNPEIDSFYGRPVSEEPVVYAKATATKATPSTPHISYVRGPVCDLESDTKSALCAAWALILSSQINRDDSSFNLCVLDPKTLQPAYLSPPIYISVNRQEQISAFLKRVADTPALSGLLNPEYIPGSTDKRNVSFQLIVGPSESALGAKRLSGNSGWTIRLECVVKDQELELSAAFDESCFSKATVRLLLNDLEHVLWQLDSYSSEQRTVGDIQLLSPASQRHLVRLNRPLFKQEEVLVHSLIAEQAQSRPQAQAIYAWDGGLSYSELEHHAEILASYLSGIGIGPEVLVPVIFEKSVWSIVAILGVVKSGGTVIALDPSLPAARIHMIVEDVKASVVVSSTQSQRKIPPHISNNSRVIIHRSFLEELATRAPSSKSRFSANPENGLYIVYTSGSTGNPKGVVVTHTAFASSAKGFSKTIHLDTPTARVLQYSSFSFDISMLEIFTTLMAGACLCIPSEEDRTNDLANCISSMNVNWAMLTPSVAGLIRPEEVPSLEVLCFVGEALPQAVADTWADHVKAINAYGPAECSAITIVSEPRIRGVKSISLGRPSNCAIWILDENGQLASFNTIGEIVIEGAPVARGYLGEKNKTNTAFLNDPDFLCGVVRDPTRCYRTGDLGRMNADGSIDFFGRKDSQVKINGQRVELGEIEHHLTRSLQSAGAFGLSKSPWDVAVELLQPVGANYGLLTAFVASRLAASNLADMHKEARVSETDPAWREIQLVFQEASKELAEALPVYMLPKAVVPCHILPLSPSGKVDRKALRGLGNKMTVKELLRPRSQDDGAYVSGTETSGSHSASFTDSEEESLASQHTMSSDTRSPSEASLSLAGSADLSVTIIEDSLRKAWASVLGISEDTIRPNDDFFRLGGDSIGAIKVVAASRRLGLKINVANIFKNSVLSKMALVCENTANDNHETASARLVPFQFLKQDAIPELREEASFQCNLKPEDIEDLYPCTHMQEGLMAVNLTRPGSYTGRWIHPLPRGVDLAQFKKAWEDIHATSPILRTRFATTSSAGSLQAVIKEKVQWLSHNNLEAYLEQDDSNPMFPGDSLNRFALVSTVEGDMTFVWTIHHMLYDGWSLAMLCNKLNDLYHGRAVKPAADFRHFISYTQQLSPNSNSSYWKEELRDSPLSVFPAAPKHGHHSFARAVIRDELDIDLDLTSGITMSTLVRAAWSLMVGHVSESHDVLFGATVSGRNAPLDDIENFEGPTIATVPIRVRIDRSLALLDFLRQIQDQGTAMIPFEQAGIQQIKAFNEDTKRGCEFQNLLVVQAGGGWDETGPGPLRKPVYREEFTTFPVTCEVWLNPGRVQFATHVDEEVTSRVFVAQAIETVKVIMTQLAWATSQLRCGSKVADLAYEKLPGLSQATQFQTPKPIKVSATLHHLITKKSQAQPDRDAVVSTTERLSYATLETMSSALASHLIDSGTSPGEMIPLCFEKSVWAVVAMLGVMKAGAVFVPLDSSQPISRLREVVAQVKAKTILTSTFQAKATDIGAPNCLIVDRASLEGFSSNQSAWPVAVRSNPDSPAYVIFTSGSTGNPKGIVVSHSAFASSAFAHGAVLGMSRDIRVLQFSAYSFDASLFEILTTLVHGGTICVPTERERFEGVEEFVRRENVNFALMTPSVARIVKPTEVPGLKTLVLGGEAPDEILLKKWLDSGTTLFNAYGPSECSVIAACNSCSYDADPRTIGLPVGCSAWIVDPDNAEILLPDGEAGELLVEGPTLADGYLGDPGKTAATFISTPSWLKDSRYSRGGGLLYKTGDLVRKTGDGNLIYVGRKDLQVKVNGQRIELGDIESHIAVCSFVKCGVVLFPSSGPFARQLVVVLELEKESMKAVRAPDVLARFNEAANKVRRQLANMLPSIMLPAHWVSVETLCCGRFPLLASGKVDRKQIATLLEGMGASEVDIIDKSSNASAAILPDEIPAYELAEKISTLVPSRSFYSSDTLTGGFNDILLHTSSLDSLSMMSLMHFIRLKYRVRVSMQLLMDEKTSIRTLAAFIKGLNSKQTTTFTSTSAPISRKVDILAQVNLYDEDLSKMSEKRRRAPRRRSEDRVNNLRVFLTGASGYLGTQILRQLLERRDVGHVTTLVRGANLQTARSRVIETAQKARWWTAFHEGKLEIWAGDLSKPQLGLGQEQWGLLCDDQAFDVVIHNGAVVHWNMSYSALEAVNVGSTAQLLALAVQNPSLRFAYVSGGRQWRSNDERDEDVARELADSMGYSQTKFVAEVLVKRAAERCQPGKRNIAVFKPGLIIGTPTEGVANLDDYIWRLTSAAIDVGSFNNDDDDAWLNLSDATTTAAAAIDTAFNPESQPTPVRNHEDGMSWGAFWGLVQAAGHKIRPTPASEWFLAVRQGISVQQEAHPLWPLAHLLEDSSMQWDVRTHHLSDCPVQLKIAVMKNLGFLSQVGFLPAVELAPEPDMEPKSIFRRSGFE